MGIHTDFESLYLATETHNISHTRHSTEIAVYHPVLNCFQFAHITLATAQSVAVNLSRRAIKRLYFRSDPFR